ncbi:MAG TPA: hypothetical protein DD490_17510 [Acidobacteria bacterium]|nr:hypothetical protein [Acidobacteriota bacterium]
MPMRVPVICLAAGWAACFAAAAMAQEPAPQETASAEIRRFTVARATSAVQIDGVLDEAAWKDATVISLPFEWFPGDNAAPPVATEALVTFDDAHFYVAFRASDPEPGQIRAHLMDRDAIATFVQDDHVGINLDTFDDERRAFQFRINPLGVQVDAVFSEIDAAEDFSWDAIWSAEGVVTDQGYTVEVAIPFKQLRFPRTDAPQTWGFEAFRSYPRSVRHRISSRFTDRAKDCTLCQENKIAGLQGIAPGRNVEITPTVTALRSDAIDRFPDGELVKGDEDAEPGATVRWGITPNLSLNAAVNPDFSQVEADVAQLDVNTRFALFFPEKRPFFLEGADLYLTPLQAVFTRTVAEPELGLKLSGKEGKNAFGVFVARDEINNVLLPSNQGSEFAFLRTKVDSGVVRFRRDVGQRSAVGVLYTGREGDGYHNRVAGLDGFVRFTESDTVRVQYLRSDTLYPQAVATAFGQRTDPFRGDGLQVQYDHFADDWKGYVFYRDLDPLFRADSGFIPRVDVKTTEARGERFFYGTDETWYAQMSVGARGLRTEDHHGTLTDQTVEVFGTLNGPLQSLAEVYLSRNREFFAGTVYDLDRQTAYTQISPSGNVRLSLGGLFGDQIDYANARKGRIFELTPGVLLRLGRHVSLQLDHAFQTLDVDGGELYEIRLTQLQAIYQHNVRTFVRAIVQYQDLQSHPGLYNEPREPEAKDLFGQFLFSYKLNPQTVLFVGYTDSRAGLRNVGLTQTGRTFFLKLGYAFLY